MQTSYQAEYDQLLAGMITPGSVKETITLIAEADTSFGDAVKRGTLPEDQGLPPAQDEVAATIVGIAARVTNEDGIYAEARSDEMKILTKGNIAVNVLAADTPVAGDSAYMIVDGTNFGKWTTTAGANTVDAGAVFQSAKKNDDLAVIKVDIVA